MYEVEYEYKGVCDERGGILVYIIRLIMMMEIDISMRCCCDEIGKSGERARVVSFLKHSGVVWVLKYE